LKEHLVPTRPNERPLRADARRNRDQIVATARELFAELGPDAPLDLVARRAGLGSGTLYRHFPTRGELIEAVYRDDIAELADSAARLARQHPPLPALQLWVREVLIPTQEPGGVGAALHAALAGAPDVLAGAKQEFTDAVNQLVEAAQAAGHVRRDITSGDILRMTHGIAVASADAPDARRRMVMVMFDGMRAP
jgi:AcrR family transcriptional regulator